MMHIGCARDLHDVEGALTLATRTFRSQEGPSEEAVDVKRLLMSPCGTLSEKDVVVLVNSTGEICGACFLVDRDFYRGARKLKGTFLTSIYIAESSRGKGLSRLLMDSAIVECERRSSAFAILIARRAVDHFYNKFSFWGLSQYSKINLKLAGILSSGVNYSISPAIEEDLAAVGGLYESTYSGLYGSCVRSVEYWRYVLWKTGNKRISFSVFKMKGRVSGYVIFSGSEIYELAAVQDDSCFELLKELGVKHSLNDVTLHFSSQHPIVCEFDGVDFSIAKRQCSYGGHMVRVIDQGILLNCLEKEMQDEGCDLGIKNYTEMHADTAIGARKGGLGITLSGSPFDFKNTCFLMGSESLSIGSSLKSICRPRSFNVPLLDQV